LAVEVLGPSVPGGRGQVGRAGAGRRLFPSGGGLFGGGARFVHNVGCLGRKPRGNNKRVTEVWKISKTGDAVQGSSELEVLRKEGAGSPNPSLTT